MTNPVRIASSPHPDADIDAIIECVENVKRMRRAVGWDAVARAICVDALLAAESIGVENISSDGRLKTLRLIEYTLRQLKARRDG